MRGAILALTNWRSATNSRTYVGNVASETPRQVILRLAGQDNMVINKYEIQNRETNPNAMMPKGPAPNIKGQRGD